MLKTLAIAAAAVAMIGCSQGETYESGGDVDTMSDTSAALGIPDLDVDVTTDTLNVPTFSTEKDTIIVDKPVISGDKPVTIKRPTIRRDSL